MFLVVWHQVGRVEGLVSQRGARGLHHRPMFCGCAPKHDGDRRHEQGKGSMPRPPQGGRFRGQRPKRQTMETGGSPSPPLPAKFLAAFAEEPLAAMRHHHGPGPPHFNYEQKAIGARAGTKKSRSSFPSIVSMQQSHKKSRRGRAVIHSVQTRMQADEPGPLVAPLLGASRGPGVNHVQRGRYPIHAHFIQSYP